MLYRAVLESVVFEDAPDILDLTGRLASLVALLVLSPIAPHRRLHPFAERVDAFGAHAVQPARLRGFGTNRPHTLLNVFDRPRVGKQYVLNARTNGTHRPVKARLLLDLDHGRHLREQIDRPAKVLLICKSQRKVAAIAEKLYKLFLDKDASIVEVNPLVKTDAGNFYAIDGKLNFDDNALYRHPDLVALRDETEEDAKEIEASKYDLSYITLDGAIGCMVNGAGLAMATMDIIQHYGAAPANFLDVGGSATIERVTEAFKIILSDNKVEGILVNIFGGIMKCDVIAQGIINAAKTI